MKHRPAGTYALLLITSNTPGLCPLLESTTSALTGAFTVLRLTYSSATNAPSIDPLVVLNLILLAASDFTMSALSAEESVTEAKRAMPPRSPTVCVKLGRLVRKAGRERGSEPVERGIRMLMVM